MAILVIKMVIKSPEGISLFFPIRNHWCCRGLLTSVGPPWPDQEALAERCREQTPHMDCQVRTQFEGKPWRILLVYSNYYWIIGSISLLDLTYSIYIYTYILYHYSSYYCCNDDTLVFWWCQLSKFGVKTTGRSWVSRGHSAGGFFESAIQSDM